MNAHWGLVALAPLLAGCQGAERGPAVVRLVDAFPEATVRGTIADPVAPERTEWTFDDDGKGEEWVAGHAVDGLAVADGVLRGTTTAEVPIVAVERPEGFPADDLLHQVVVRARVSGGTNLAVTFVGGQTVDFERMVESANDGSWSFSSPIVAGDEVQTYTFNTSSASRTSFPAAGTRHVLLRPSDTAGVDFEIDSVRLVFRQEHLATIPPGVSWQGLGEIYRETLVARAPEEIVYRLELPDDPWLELALGTVSEGPVTFRVRGGEAGAPETLLERTLTTANRWEPVTVDLASLAGRSVSLELALLAPTEGALGFWGVPAIRSRSAAAAAGPRGVLVVLIDTLRRDHLPFYGYERATAPHLSELAADGVVFRDAISQGAWTKVSVPSMMSSTYPSSNGIYEFTDRLPASAATLAESFRAAGFATWASSSVPFTGRGNNLHQGVEVLHESSSLDLPEGQSRTKTARTFVDRLLPWLDDHREGPFYAVLHVMDPHDPFRPYAPYHLEWGAADADERHREQVEKLRKVIESEFMQRLGLPTRDELAEAEVDAEEFVRMELDWYDGSLRAADAEVGRVLERLRQLDILDDTLVVFLSDHGEEFLDHGGHFHEENVYGEMTNVPLVLHWPAGLPAGHVVEETVELLDVAPSILRLAGLEVPESMQGDSLLPLLGLGTESQRWSDRPAISEWRKRSDQLDSDIVDAQSIILDGWKLVHNVDRPNPTTPEFELFDHRTDPLDQHDLAAESPEIVERLAAELEKWRRWAGERTLPTDDEAASSLDAEELERLRSLGYL